MKKTIATLSLLFVSLLVLVGCGQTPASIEVTPPNVVLNAAGQTQALAVVVLDTKGETIAQPQLAWTSSDAAVVTVDANGQITAKKSGKASITVAMAEVKKEIPIVVAIYTAIKTEAAEATLKVGEAKPLAAQVLDEAGNPIDGATVEWKVADEKIAKVDPAGVVTALAAGTVDVVATSKELSATVKITVATPVPATITPVLPELELKVGEEKKVDFKAADEAGNPVEGVVLTWTTSDEKLASVSTEGLVKAVAAGEAQITAVVPEAADKTFTVKVKIKK